MKKIITLLVTVVLSTGLNAQSKKDIISEVNDFQETFIKKQTFNVDRSVLFNAILSVGSERHKIKRESEKRGFVEFYFENDREKEIVNVEIVSENNPYDLSITVEFENRNLDFVNGGYSSWYKNNSSSSQFISNFKLRIHEKIFGDVMLPDELQKKIDSYNKKQKKYSKKITKGIDF